jgi:hypothetical protein
MGSISTDITKELELKMRSALTKARCAFVRTCGELVRELLPRYFARVALHLAPPALPSIELPFTRPVYWVPLAVKLI